MNMLGCGPNGAWPAPHRSRRPRLDPHPAGVVYLHSRLAARHSTSFERATLRALKDQNEKVNRESDRTQMSGMQWHRLSGGDATGASRAQNLSRALQEMRRQGTDIEGCQLRRVAFAEVRIAAHNALNPDIPQGPESANRRSRESGDPMLCQARASGGPHE